VENVLRSRTVVGNERHSNGDADCMAAAIHRDVVTERRGEAETDLIGDMLRLHARSEDRKFVAAKASQKITVPDFGEKSFRHDLQHFIADGVPVLVIDGFEAVEIEHVNGGDVADTAQGSFFKRSHEFTSIWQSRERVDHRQGPLLVQLCLGLAPSCAVLLFLQEPSPYENGQPAYSTESAIDSSMLIWCSLGVISPQSMARSYSNASHVSVIITNAQSEISKALVRGWRRTIPVSF
jgi:hypothetical protein